MAPIRLKLILQAVVLLIICGVCVGVILSSSFRSSMFTTTTTATTSKSATSTESSGSNIPPTWDDVDMVLSELGMDIIPDPSDEDTMRGGIGLDNPSLAVLGQCRLLKASLAGSLCENNNKNNNHKGGGGGLKTSSPSSMTPSHYTKDHMFAVVAADKEGGDKPISGGADGLLKKVVRWGGASHCGVTAPLLKRRVLCMLGVDTHSKLDGVQEAKTSWMNAACDHVTIFGKDVIPPPPTNHHIPNNKASHPKGGLGPNVTTTTTTTTTPSNPLPTVIPRGTCFARAANHGAMRLGQMGAGHTSSSSPFSHVRRRGGGGDPSSPSSSQLPSLTDHDEDGNRVYSPPCVLPDLLEVHSIGEGDNKDTSYPQLMSALGYVASIMHRFPTSSTSSSALADFDYVVVVNSGTVVIPENLRALLHDPYIDALHMLDTPLLLGHRMATKEGVPFLAQAAYILNRRLMTSLDASMGDIECFAQHFSGSQDLFFSRCAGGMLGAYPLSTEDAMGQQRIHQLDLDVVNSGGAGIDWYQTYHPGRATLQKGMRGLSRYTTIISNVPPARHSVVQRAVVAEERHDLKA